jgi:carboxymethylenebutenolidase
MGNFIKLKAKDGSGLSASIGYYGGTGAANLGEKPQCPVMLHFGEKDASIPLADAEKVKATLEPGVPVYIYPDAGHAFNRFGNQAWHDTSATLARHHRTLNFLHEKVG